MNLVENIKVIIRTFNKYLDINLILLEDFINYDFIYFNNCKLY